MRILKASIVVSSVVASSAALAIFPDTGAPEFTFVGMVGTDGGFNGSGTAITSFDVITAKHVGGNSITLPGLGTFTAIARVNHPTADLSLLRFGSALPGFYAPIFHDELGQQVTMVGFGSTGTLRGDGTGYNNTGGGGVRRKGNQMVSDRQTVNLGGGITNSVSLLYDLDGNGQDTFEDGGPIAGEAGQNFGDSGGGWFRNVSGQQRIVAVNSFIFDAHNNGNSFDFGDGGGAVDLFEYQEWITANTVPEPASMAALALGLAAVARRRRKN